MITSKRRRIKKAATAGAVLLAVMLAASACSGANTKNTSNEPNGAVTEGPVVDKLPEGSGVIEPDVSAPEPSAAGTNNSSGTEDPDADEVKRGEGTFTGLIDSHSIEIETEAGAMAFQITEELASAIDNLPSDAEVAFEYTEKAIEGETGLKQYWIVKIEKTK
jgi:uncharacterized low-complexity protein